MAKTEITIVFGERARQSIRNISIYIEENGSPERAETFTNTLFDFGYSLASFPEKHPICRKKAWIIKQFRCAIFSKNYIFVYKVIRNKLIVYNVVNVASIN